ncbi:MAG TPA: PKD domain-containing protein [Solirubrobacteraceae bacterium]|nr:PKD domain-containing protein [Solirubrobacteraceae bacterium]
MSTRLPLSSTAISRPLRLLLLLVAALLFAAIRPSLSHAVVKTVGSASFGVQPETLAAPIAPLTPVDYNGGPVVHSSAPYAIFWDPHTTLGGYEYVTQHYIESFSDESGALDNVFAVTSQYGDGTGNAAYSSTFRGAYTDTDAFPSTGNCSEGSACLTDAQIRTELAKVITSLGLPTGLNPAGGPTPTYMIFTPASATVCLEGSGESGNCSKEGGSGEPLCSYHSFTTVNAATVLYAVEPLTLRTGCQDGTGELQEPNKEFYEGLNAGEVNVLVNNIAAEEVAMVTDPTLNGWHETNGTHEEVPDKCRNEFKGGQFVEGSPEDTNQTIAGTGYYVNDEYNQAALFDGYPARPCLNEVKNEPKFTSTSPIRSGDVATFNATSSYVDLGVDKYNWSFGDGTSAEVNCAGRTPTYGVAPDECTTSSGVGNPNPVASVAHAYAYGGEYEVTLSITDGGGNVASTTHVIDVSGTPAPSSAGSAGGATSGSNTTAAGAATTTAATPGTTAGLPPAAKLVAATQSVSSRRLSAVLKEGIVVHYSVNEQVAGRFEVLLSSSIARRIGLRGTSAAGLAKGTPAQTVIAKAILVTTKGGRSTYKIKFDKATAAKLRKLRKVTLMIRLVVHNASSPTATTVLDTVNLH